jgi:hypothetical protein
MKCPICKKKMPSGFSGEVHFIDGKPLCPLCWKKAKDGDVITKPTVSSPLISSPPIIVKKEELKTSTPAKNEQKEHIEWGF